MQIIIDNRENDPFTFRGYDNITTSWDTLDCGDYTITAHDRERDDHSIIIERKKNSNELLRNIGADWERFKIELVKMQRYTHKMIIVCSPENSQYLYERELTKLSPNFVRKRLAEIYLDFQVPTLFFSDKVSAEDFVFRLFYATRKKALD